MVVLHVLGQDVHIVVNVPDFGSSRVVEEDQRQTHMYRMSTHRAIRTFREGAQEFLGERK